MTTMTTSAGVDALTISCQRDDCEAETLVHTRDGQVTGYQPGCNHHQAWRYIEATAREHMAEAGPGRGTSQAPPATGSGGPPAEATRAVKEAILEATGYAPAARKLTTEQCRQIAEAVLEADAAGFEKMMEDDTSPADWGLWQHAFLSAMNTPPTFRRFLRMVREGTALHWWKTDFVDGIADGSIKPL